jgi:hypothetical protein
MERGRGGFFSPSLGPRCTVAMSVFVVQSSDEALHVRIKEGTMVVIFALLLLAIGLVGRLASWRVGESAGGLAVWLAGWLVDG